MISNFDTVSARQYLDKAGDAYLTAINGINLESLQKYKDELLFFTQHLRDPQFVMTLGVGNGVELHALKDLTGADMVGIDLSFSPLRVASRHSKLFEVAVNYYQGSGLQLPLADSSIDGVSFSSVLHEVFSYVPNGIHATMIAISEACRVLRSGGLLYIKDFATENKPNEKYFIRLKTDFALKFYDLFIQHYKGFESWTNDAREKMLEFTNDDAGFPVREGVPTVMLSSWQSSEFLMHLRNAFNDYGKAQFELTTDGVVNWKEINETYHVGTKEGAFSPKDYISLVSAVIRTSTGSKDGNSLVDHAILYRETNARGLSYHVSIEGMDDLQSQAKIAEITGKMQALFRVTK